MKKPESAFASEEDAKSSGKILVVDDDISNLHIIAGFLAQSGLSLTFYLFYLNGNDALDESEKQNFDPVLLDVMMPGGADNRYGIGNLGSRNRKNGSRFLSRKLFVGNASGQTLK